MPMWIYIFSIANAWARRWSIFIHLREASAQLVLLRWAIPGPRNVGRAASTAPRFSFLHKRLIINYSNSFQRRGILITPPLWAYSMKDIIRKIRSDYHRYTGKGDRPFYRIILYLLFGKNHCFNYSFWLRLALKRNWTWPFAILMHKTGQAEFSVHLLKPGD